MDMPPNLANRVANRYFSAEGREGLILGICKPNRLIRYRLDSNTEVIHALPTVSLIGNAALSRVPSAILFLNQLCNRAITFDEVVGRKSKRVEEALARFRLKRIRRIRAVHRVKNDGVDFYTYGTLITVV